MAHRLRAGAAARDITPRTPQFLYGYPHVPRFHTGVHDPLLSSALLLDDGQTRVLFIANDVIFVGRDLVARARHRISLATGIPQGNMLISATHTHSGPVTVDYLSNEADPVVPKADPEYLALLEEGIVQAGIAAAECAQPAELAFAHASGAELGTNRRQVDGPADPTIPVLWVRAAETRRFIACMLVCAMHPTVLHEDSTVISSDFPGLGRRHLCNQVLGRDGVVVHHLGAAGNQSPRRVTRANTLEEADRLGRMFADAVAQTLDGAAFQADVSIAATQRFVELVPAVFPEVASAEHTLELALARLTSLRASGAPRHVVRTAECDWFGAEETVTLARAAAEGRLNAVRRAIMPAEIQHLRVGPWSFAGWPGEIFVEYALELRAADPGAFLITLANGELQGYIVTPGAAAEGGYEACNAVFAAESGAILLKETLAMLEQHQTRADA